MKRFVASLWMCWAAYCGYDSNTVPLAFGMTLEEAALALGLPLYLYSSQDGSEIYVAYGQRPAWCEPIPLPRRSRSNSATVASRVGRRIGSCGEIELARKLRVRSPRSVSRNGSYSVALAARREAYWTPAGRGPDTVSQRWQPH
jgi:hypothetical protein